MTLLLSSFAHTRKSLTNAASFRFHAGAPNNATRSLASSSLTNFTATATNTTNSLVFQSTSPFNGHACYTNTSFRSIHVERRLEEIGYELPPAPKPKANYNIVCHASGNMLYVSGHLPIKTDGSLLTGKIGSEYKTLEHGKEAAKHCALNIIATLKNELGDLDRVEKVVKVFGIVQSCETFKDQHLVMDGCSDTLMQVFGPTVGYHARSAIGTSTLPLDMSVEVEAIVQIKPK